MDWGGEQGSGALGLEKKVRASAQRTCMLLLRSLDFVVCTGEPVEVF